MDNLPAAAIANIDIVALIQAMGLGLLFALFLGYFIKRFSRLMGNKAEYLIIFTVLIPTMVLIISVIKSSLALSLGLVGALSIVRFRTPIKEPEELAYIFLAIAVGLGLGAGQILATSIAFSFVLIILLISAFLRNSHDHKGAYLDVEVPGASSKSLLNKFSKIFKEDKISFDLKRYEDAERLVNATYFIETLSGKALEDLIAKLKTAQKDAKITLINGRSTLG